MRAIKIPANPLSEMTEVDIPSTFPEINEACLGNLNYLIEQVYAKGLHPLAKEHGREFVLLIDEEGFAHSLGLNKRASLLYGTHVHGQPIVGDAFVVACGFDDWVGLPDKVGVQQIIDTIKTSREFSTEIFA
jgi:hypothetical protein